MGLFDSLLNAGKKALNDAATKEIADKLDDTLGSVMKGISSAASGLDSDTFGKEAASYNNKTKESENENSHDNYPYSYDNSTEYDEEENYDDSGSFDEKLSGILVEIGSVNVERYIEPDVFEQQYGQTVYTRGGCYALPDRISYKLTGEGGKVLYIRLWDDYNRYNHIANRQIKTFCNNNGIKMIDFFNYMPNRYSYMKKRIQDNL